MSQSMISSVRIEPLVMIENLAYGTRSLMASASGFRVFQYTSGSPPQKWVIESPSITMSGRRSRISATQAAIWDGLRLAGVTDRIEGYGRLFSEF